MALPISFSFGASNNMYKPGAIGSGDSTRAPWLVMSRVRTPSEYLLPAGSCQDNFIGLLVFNLRSIRESFRAGGASSEPCSEPSPLHKVFSNLISPGKRKLEAINGAVNLSGNPFEAGHFSNWISHLVSSPNGDILSLPVPGQRPCLPTSAGLRNGIEPDRLKEVLHNLRP